MVRNRRFGLVLEACFFLLYEVRCFGTECEKWPETVVSDGFWKCFGTCGRVRSLRTVARNRRFWVPRRPRGGVFPLERCAPLHLKRRLRESSGHGSGLCSPLRAIRRPGFLVAWLSGGPLFLGCGGVERHAWPRAARHVVDLGPAKPCVLLYQNINVVNFR